MKKTLTINISGIIFHIDEDAYDKLNSYLAKLKRHFNNTQGKDEIITDIEGRIAELLQEKTNDAKQVISIEDINEVIGLMGEPGEFETEGEVEEERVLNEEYRRPKRLFRDPDNKMVGGVASGLAAYFNLDPVWFRLAFVLITLVGGSGVLIYFVMWVILPEANTTAEKLEMRGETVNISNIEKSIREEVSHIGEKLNDLTNKAKRSVEKKNVNGDTVFEQLLGVFISILKIFLRVVLIIVGIVLLITGISLILAFVVGLFGWGGPLVLDNNDVIMMPLTNFFGLLPISTGGAALLKIGLILTLGIPLLMLIYNGFRMIFRVDRIRYIGITALNLWIVGLIICVFFAFKIGKEYRQQAIVSKHIEISQPASDTLYVMINPDYEDELLYNSYDYIRADDVHLIATEEGIFYDQIELDIKKSNDNNYSLTRYMHSRGRSLRDAKENASATVWTFTQEDSLLILDPYFNLGTSEFWRGQHLELEINIPVGYYINFDNNSREILNWGKYNPRKLVGKTWVMTEDGLKDPNEPGFVSPTIMREEPVGNGSIAKPIVMNIVGLVW